MAIGCSVVIGLIRLPHRRGLCTTFSGLSKQKEEKAYTLERQEARR